MTELMPSLCNDCVARNQCGKDDVKMCISYTKEIKIKCDDCKFQEDCVDYGWDGCKKFTQKQPHTNEEWLRSCTTEELVKMILDLCDYRPCFACGIGYCDDENWCHVYSDEAKEFVLEWLKQPHTKGVAE